jgi:hypothetical protein
MGREERCDGDCSEQKLVLVSAVECNAMLTAAHAARDRAARLAPAVRPFTDEHPGDPREVLSELKQTARVILRATARETDRTDWSSAATVTGWWCAKCGNVDMPQPCIGVCVWRRAEWVNVIFYEQQLRLAEPHLHAAHSLTAFLVRAASVIARDGEWPRNLEALERQARAALDHYTPDAPAPEAPSLDPLRPEAEPVIRIDPWPR